MERPLRIMKPERTIKGNKVGIILRYHISKPLEANKIHLSEKKSKRTRKRQQKNVTVS